jgi:NAD(P)-dependent dehydrogenase (short-subunit alcohol dehydrogenase family)
MDRLDGKVAVVTGSASGIGRGIATRFAEEGMTVVVADRRLDAAEEVATALRGAGRRAQAMEVDVTSRASVEALADRVDAELGGAHVLVNNAGVAAPSPLHEPEEKNWRWVMEVNLWGVLYGVQTFVPRMLALGEETHIVNTASLGGVIGPVFPNNRTTGGNGNQAHDPNLMKSYMVSKHGVVALSEGLAGDLQGTTLGVSVLCPAHHDDTWIYENSAKYRPAEYGGPMSTDTDLHEEANKRAEDGGKDTAELAARVVRAIRERHFWIFTHPETRSWVEARMAGMLAGFDDSASFTG